MIIACILYSRSAYLVDFPEARRYSNAQFVEGLLPRDTGGLYGCVRTFVRVAVAVPYLLHQGKERARSAGFEGF